MRVRMSAPGYAPCSTLRLSVAAWGLHPALTAVIRQVQGTLEGLLRPCTSSNSHGAMVYTRAHMHGLFAACLPLSMGTEGKGLHPAPCPHPSLQSLTRFRQLWRVCAPAAHKAAAACVQAYLFFTMSTGGWGQGTAPSPQLGQVLGKHNCLLP